MKNVTKGAALASLLVLSAGASADPLIDTVGNPTNASTVTSLQYNMVQFSLTSDFTDVDIDASLVTSLTSAETGTAYLTDQTGAGTTAANVIASGSFNFVNVGNASTDIGWVDLFSGLSLNAGTYFLIVGAPISAGGGAISLSPAATYATDPAATVDGMFFSAGANVDAGFTPASTFVGSGLGNRFIRVSGVPTPGSVAVLGFAGLAAARRRR